MASMSDYLEVELRKHLFRTGSYTKPAALWIALFTTTPGEAGGGTEVTKAGGTGYLRVQRDPLDANWTAPDGTGGVTRNATAVAFPTPTANWGTVVACAIFDSDDGGTNNILFWSPLGASKTINSGDPAPVFDADALTITFA